MARHRLLERQVRRYLGLEATIPPDIQALLTAVEDAYEQFDNDRRLTHRAMELSSRELMEANAPSVRQRGFVSAYVRRHDKTRQPLLPEADSQHRHERG